MGLILQGAVWFLKLLYTFNFQRSQLVLGALDTLLVKLQMLVSYWILNRIQWVAEQ